MSSLCLFVWSWSITKANQSTRNIIASPCLILENWYCFWMRSEGRTAQKCLQRAMESFPLEWWGHVPLTFSKKSHFCAQIFHLLALIYSLKPLTGQLLKSRWDKLWLDKNVYTLIWVTVCSRLLALQAATSVLWTFFYPEFCFLGYVQPLFRPLNHCSHLMCSLTAVSLDQSEFSCPSSEIASYLAILMKTQINTHFIYLFDLQLIWAEMRQ